METLLFAIYGFQIPCRGYSRESLLVLESRGFFLVIVSMKFSLQDLIVTN